jgi:hypothetical protein
VAFTVNDLNDLIRILREQPEWLREVRRVVLTDELLALPDLVRELAEAQRRTDERLAEFQRRTDERFAELAEAQRRTDERLAEFQQRIEQQLAEFQRRTDERFAELAEAQRRTDERLAEFQQRIEQQLAEFQRRTDERFAELAEFQRRTDERFAELAEFQRRTDERFAELAEAQRRTDEQVAEMRGTLLEVDYRAKVGAIFGGRLRKPKAVDPGDLWDLLRGRLDELEIRQVVTSDLIVRGQLLPPQAQGESDLWMTVEVSSVIDRNDVARAADRAELLRKAGLPAIPVAAGKRLTQGASLLAAQLRVVLVKNGNPIGWDNALESTLHWRPPAA